MAETWNSAQLCRLLQQVHRQLPDGQAKADLKRVVERLERTCTEQGCPTCGSSFYTFEEASET